MARQLQLRMRYIRIESPISDEERRATASGGGTEGAKAAEPTRQLRFALPVPNFGRLNLRQLMGSALTRVNVEGRTRPLLFSRMLKISILKNNP